MFEEPQTVAIWTGESFWDNSWSYMKESMHRFVGQCLTLKLLVNSMCAQ